MEEEAGAVEVVVVIQHKPMEVANIEKQHILDMRLTELKTQV